MPGPPPKAPGARQRTNKTSTAAQLPPEPRRGRKPSLPGDRDWHAMTRRFWRDLWRSPLAGELLQVDDARLVMLAILTDDFWRADDAAARSKLAAELRLQGQCFGLTPIDRRRLQWTMSDAPPSAPAPAATERTERGSGPDDPRRLLVVA